MILKESLLVHIGNSYFIPSSYHQTNQQFSHELSPRFSDSITCAFGLSVWLVSVNRCHLKGSFICLVTGYSCPNMTFHVLARQASPLTCTISTCPIPGDCGRAANSQLDVPCVVIVWTLHFKFSSSPGG